MKNLRKNHRKKNKITRILKKNHSNNHQTSFWMSLRKRNKKVGTSFWEKPISQKKNNPRKKKDRNNQISYLNKQITKMILMRLELNKII